MRVMGLGVVATMVLLMPDMFVVFLAASMAAGLGFAAWFSRYSGLQRLFGGAEQPTIKVTHELTVSRRPIWIEAWTSPAALIGVGILIGFLLNQLLIFALQLHAQPLAHVTMLV